MKKLIIFLVRKRLGLKKYSPFRFANQKTKAIYYFGTDTLDKNENGNITPSGVSLNWLLNEDCQVVLVPWCWVPLTFPSISQEDLKYGN